MNYKREVIKGRQLSETEEKELTKKIADYFIENDGYVVKRQDLEGNIYYQLYIDGKIYAQFNHNIIDYVGDFMSFISIADKEDFHYTARTEKVKKRFFGLLGTYTATTTENYYNFNTEYFTEYILSKIKIKKNNMEKDLKPKELIDELAENMVGVNSFSRSFNAMHQTYRYEIDLDGDLIDKERLDEILLLINEVRYRASVELTITYD